MWLLKKIEALLFMAACFLGCQIALASDPIDSWSNNQVDISGSIANEAHISVSSDGTQAAAIWVVNDGINDLVKSASSTIKGNVSKWGPSIVLSALGHAIKPQIHLSADGSRAAATWVLWDGANWVIQAAIGTFEDTGIKWGVVRTLSTKGENSFSPNISLSADGARAIIIFVNESSEYRFSIKSFSAKIDQNEVYWSVAKNISEAAHAVGIPQIAFSADGTQATAAWTLDGMAQTSSATIVGNAATWGVIKNLSERGVTSSIEVALSADGGKATLIWYRNYDNKSYFVESSSAKIVGNTADWGSVARLSTILPNAGGLESFPPQVRLSSDGARATAIWFWNDGSDAMIQSSSSTIVDNAAAWASPINISTAFSLGTMVVMPSSMGLSADGTRATAIWFFCDDGAFVVQSSSAIITNNIARWGLEKKLSNALFPDIAISSDGTKATALWVLENCRESILESSSAVITYPGPTSPNNVVAVPGPGNIRVIFEPSLGNSPIIYEAICSSTSVGAATPVRAQGSNSPLLITGVTVGASYLCSVIATDSNGSSSPSVAINGEVVPTQPSTTNPIPALTALAQSFMILSFLVCFWLNKRSINA